MNIAVCDDEPAILDDIERLIRARDKKSGITKLLSAEALLSHRRFEDFELFYIDIGLPGEDGMSAAFRIRKLCPRAVIVFITADTSRVFEAFDVAALHYLKKPVDEETFYRVFELAVKQVKNNRRGKGDNTDSLLLKVGDRHVYLRKSDIRYVESQGRKLIIAAGDEAVEIYGVLSHYEKLLGPSFYRCHRSYLVNLSFIKGYDSESISLTGGGRVWLSKERYGDFVRTYMKWLKAEVKPVGESEP